MSHHTHEPIQAPARPSRRGRACRVVIAVVLGLSASLIAAPVALAGFGVQKLHLGTVGGSEDYLYTAGNTVASQGSVDPARYYRFDVSDPSGTVHFTSACRPSPAKGVVTASYPIQSSDPLSTTTAWRFRLREFTTASNCGSASSAQHDQSLYFDVAAASSYSSSALTTKNTVFKASAVAYLQLGGVGNVKGNGTNNAQGLGSWNTTWILPSGATACANTGGSDRPGSTAGGQLPDRTSWSAPAQPNLQYRPSLTSGVDPWNLESNYETRPCQDFTSTNQGQWRLKIQRDNQHFVTLPAFTVDTTPPTTTLTSGLSHVTSSTSARFDFTSSEANSTFQCSLDNAPAGPCTSPQTYNSLANGPHTFKVQAIDPAGNVDPTGAGSSWTVDTTAPAVTLSAPTAGSYTNNPTPMISGTAEVGSGSVTVDIYSGTDTSTSPVQSFTVPVQSDGSWTGNPPTLPDGTYTVQARETDAASNTGYSPQRSFTVDTTPPIVTLSTPANGTHTNDSTPFISGTAGTAPSDVPSVTVTVTGGTSPVQATATVSSQGTWAIDLPQVLPDGNYTVRVTQQDLAGNTGANAHALTVDTTPPQTFLDAAPVGATGSTTAVFSFHATDALSQVGSTFQCQLDGGAWASCSSPTYYYNLAAGSHTFVVQSIDGAGNVDTAGQTATWTINGSLPAITLETPPVGSITNDTTPTFSGVAGTAAGDSSSVQVLIYNNTDLSGSPIQTLNATAASDGSWSVDAARLSDGTYVAYAQQSGTAGTGTSAAHAFTVQTQPPTATITLGPAGTTGSGVASFSFISSETGSTFQCQLDGGGWTTCVSPQHYSGLSNGSHTFQVRAIDQAGNTGAAANQTWAVNTSLPALSLTGPSDGTVTNDPAPAITGTAGTAPGDSNTVTVKVYNGTDVSGSPVETITTTVSSSTGAWSTHPNPWLPDGTYTTYAQQAGLAGTAYTSASSFTVNTTPPITSITSGPQGLTSATSARFTFASSESGSTFACQLDGGAWTACSSPQSYSSLAVGSHTFSVRATDPAGNVDPNPPAATWTIDATVPVTLTTPADGMMTNHTTPTFSGAASGANGPISVEIDDASGNVVETLTAPQGTTWSAIAAPALAEGSYTAFAYQLDSNGIDSDYSAPISFTIDLTPPAVTLVSPLKLTNNATPTFSGPAGTAAGDLSTVRVDIYSGTSASGTPVQTLSTTAAAGAWSATAASLADGTYTVRARQSDSAGNTGYSVSRTFKLDTTPPTTTITSAAPASPTNATTATPSFTSSKSGSTFECRVDTGAWSNCTSPQSYSSLSDGAHTFSVRATDPAGNVDPNPPSQSWTVDTTAPSVTLTGMPTSATNNPTPSFSGAAGTASGDLSTVTVKIYSGASASGTPVQTLSATAPGGAWSATASSLADGTYTVQAEQSDTSGNTGQSTAHTFGVDTTPPATTISSGPTSSTTDASASFSFTSSEAGSTFECQLDGGSWTACSSPKFYSSLAVGTHTFSVRATDQAGNLEPSPPVASWNIVATPPPTTTPPPSGSVSPSPSTTPASDGLPTAVKTGAGKLQLVLTAKRRQRLSRRSQLKVQARCAKACSLSLSGTVKIVARARWGVRTKPRTLTIRRVLSRRLAAGKSIVLTINLPVKTRNTIKSALRARQRVTLTLVGLPTAPGLTSGAARVTIQLVL